MGFWNALTLQGKIAIAAAVLGGLFILSLAYGDDNDTPDSSGPGFSTAIIQGQGAATNTPTAGGNAPISTAGSPSPTAATVVSGSPQAGSPTPVAATEPPQTGATATTSVPTTVPTAVPTSVPIPPTPVPPPPPPPTETPGCQVQASVSNAETVNAQLTCSGAPAGAGIAMTASFNFESLGAGCSGASNSGGSASCTVRPGGATGTLRSVDVCMSPPSGRVCTSVQ